MNMLKVKSMSLYERHIFNSYVQTDESLDDFIVQVKHYATNCDYGDLKDQLIRDRIVTGTKHQDLKQKLLNQEHTDLTLDKCVHMCKTYDATKCQMKTMGDKNSSVHGVGKQNFKKIGYIAHCNFCGKGHESKMTKCYAFGKVCEKCNGANHVPAKCPTNPRSKHTQRQHKSSSAGAIGASYGRNKSKNQHNKHKQRPRAHAVDSVEADDQGTGSDSATDYSSSDYDACMISIERPHGSVEQSEIEVHNVHDLKCGRKYEKKVLATMELVGNSYPVTMQIDSGAECNVLP